MKALAREFNQTFYWHGVELMIEFSILGELIL